jgi:hypothetical protein
METKTKYYTAEQISKKYHKLSMKSKLHILSTAIDIMQQYNGRSKFLCIAMAMGYENKEGETCHDRMVRQAEQYANNALNGEKDVKVDYI